MKVLGIIVEYNPFHQGHIHHIEEAKKLVNPDVTIAIMSGNFVQRGEVAISDKWTRASVAVNHGVDLVIELPLIYSLQSADYFAKGSIDLLKHIGVTDIVFGSEGNNIDVFKDIAYTIKNNNEEYNNLVKQYLETGIRYPDACNQALSSLCNTTITTPNDLLGLAYVKEVINHDYEINLHCIERTNDFHSQELQEISSASAIRKALKENKDVSNQLVDFNKYDEFYFFDDFFPLLRYKLLTTSLDELKEIHLVDEGIEYLLKEKILEVNNMDELVNALSSKRYTRLRIQRMLCHILMNNKTKDILDASNIDYLRILKMNDIGQAYLNTIKKAVDYKIVTNYSSYNHPALDLEFKATKLLSCLSTHPQQIIESEYKNNPKT